MGAQAIAWAAALVTGAAVYLFSLRFMDTVWAAVSRRVLGDAEYIFRKLDLMFKETTLRRCQQVVWGSGLFGLVLGVLVTWHLNWLALFLFWLSAGPALIDLITTSQPVRDFSRNYLFLAALTAFTGVLAFVMDGVMSGATLSRLIRNGMVASFLIYMAASYGLEHLFGLSGLWLSLHVFFLVRGAIFWLGVKRHMPCLFPAP